MISNALDSEMKAEYKLIKSEIRRKGALFALRSAQDKFDKSASTFFKTSILPVACENGCSYCCSFNVDVKAVEVLAVAEYVKKYFSGAEITEILLRTENNIEHLKTLTRSEQFSANIQCPFLTAGSCMIYAARPNNCRKFNSTDVQKCREIFENPDNIEIEAPALKGIHSIGIRFFDTFNLAMVETGFDVTDYELNSAFAEAMSCNEPLERFLKRDRAFINAIAV